MAKVITPPTLQPRNLTEYVSNIERQRHKEKQEASAKFEISKKDLETLDNSTKVLLDELFNISQIEIERAVEVIEELKNLSKERVKLSMAKYKWEIKLYQLRYI